MTTGAWVGFTIGILLAMGIAAGFFRQWSPADLSEQDGKPPRQGRHVAERPAGPDAEPMDTEPSRSTADSPEPPPAAGPEP